MTVMTMNRDALTYYAMPGPFTDLSAHDARVRDLPGRCRSSARWSRD